MSLKKDSIGQIDKSGMFKFLLDFPAQLIRAQKLVQEVRVSFKKSRIKKVVFSGVGGSSAGADLVSAYLYSQIKIPVSVFREYDLPAYVDKSTLVFTLSYSGNTEEVLSAYAQAKEKKALIVAVSSGGKLKERALKDNTVFIEIPKGIPPRCALGYLSIIPLCILLKLGLVKDSGFSLKRTAKSLEGLRDSVLIDRIGPKDNIAKACALRLLNKAVIIYSGAAHFNICATRLKNQINENAKALSWSNFFPETNHNEIAGWDKRLSLLKNFTVVFLRDKLMHQRLSKRMDITRGILKKEGVDFIELWSQGRDLLSRIFSLIYIGDFVSYYLAILYRIDPYPVEKIDYLKTELARE